MRVGLTVHSAVTSSFPPGLTRGNFCEASNGGPFGGGLSRREPFGANERNTSMISPFGVTFGWPSKRLIVGRKNDSSKIDEMKRFVGDGALMFGGSLSTVTVPVFYLINVASSRHLDSSKVTFGSPSPNKNK